MVLSPGTHQEIQTENGRFIRHQNGLLYFYMHDNLPIDIAVARQMVSDARSLDDSGKARLMVIYGTNSDLTFGAQRYFATVTGFTHLAFVTRSRIQVEVGQLLSTVLQVLKSSYEFRVFHDVALAETWLLQQ